MKSLSMQDKAFSANSICRGTKEHDWQSTTAPNFRRCGRASCLAMQRNDHGTWIDVKKAEQVQSASAQQFSLWS